MHSSQTDGEFIQRFKECEISAEEWSHEAHIRVACLYSKAFPFDEALSQIRSGIKRLNSVIGVRKRGYHETITVFYLNLIFPRVREMKEWNWELFKKFNPELFNPEMLYAHYSEELLNSTIAMGTFVEPDKIVK